jgi:hypothetical protein
LNYILKENHGMKIAVVENGVILQVSTNDTRVHTSASNICRLVSIGHSAATHSI